MIRFVLCYRQAVSNALMTTWGRFSLPPWRFNALSTLSPDRPSLAARLAITCNKHKGEKP